MTTTTDRLKQLAAAYQARADALLLAAEELNGHHTARKQKTAGSTLAAAVALRQSQREENGGKRIGRRPSRKPRKQDAPSKLASRLKSIEKARIVAKILQAQGPLTIKDLSTAARAAGIPNLTGIYNYVKMGYITRRGSVKAHGKSKYAFGKLPPPAGAESASA